MRNEPGVRARLGALAAAVDALFALSTPTAIANTVNVSNCNDSGPGSLRLAIQLAGNGDTVDLRQLPTLGCSRITLTTGQIGFTTDNLTLLGPDSDVTVSGRVGRDAPEVGRIFYHIGGGTLKLVHLTVRDGNASGPYFVYAQGGCIRSFGTVYLLHASVQACIANGASESTGGGIQAKGLTAKYSTISGNTAGGASQNLAAGGGVYVSGQTIIKFSTISSNRALSATGNALGGGALLSGETTIFASTISGNYSAGDAGGLSLYFGNPNPTATITDSTISGNSAFKVGGIYSRSVALNLQNSTVAFNTAVQGSYDFAPGLAISSQVPDLRVDLQSSLISDNTYAGKELDFSLYSVGTGYGVSLSGADNLIQKSLGPVPTGTLSNVCPRLGALRDNGGPTKTHALLSFSAAIDSGNDNAIDPVSHLHYVSDQRGAVRVDHGAADIGAYEVQQDDIVFNDAFDGCG